jgi:hypothetical protein
MNRPAAQARMEQPNDGFVYRRVLSARLQHEIKSIQSSKPRLREVRLSFPRYHPVSTLTARVHRAERYALGQRQRCH